MSYCLRDNVEKYRKARDATDNNTIRRMRMVCYITKATNTLSEYMTLLFHSKNGYAKAPQFSLYTYIASLVHITEGQLGWLQRILNTVLTRKSVDQ
jgi:flagellin-specific chaperone FliS